MVILGPLRPVLLLPATIVRQGLLTFVTCFHRTSVRVECDEPSRNFARDCFIPYVLRNPHCVSAAPSGYVSYYAGRFPRATYSIVLYDRVKDVETSLGGGKRTVVKRRREDNRIISPSMDLIRRKTRILRKNSFRDSQLICGWLLWLRYIESPRLNVRFPIRGSEKLPNVRTEDLYLGKIWVGKMRKMCDTRRRRENSRVYFSKFFQNGNAAAGEKLATTKDSTASSTKQKFIVEDEGERDVVEPKRNTGG